MSITVNTNVSSINAQRQLTKSTKSLDTAMARLSSGLRINTSADDAAGLAISTGITSQTNGLTQAARNANDGLSVVGTAEGALQTQTTILQRIRTLAVQAANDINSGDDRAAIQDEIDAQIAELTRLGNTTTFNGINLLDGSFSNKQLQVGAYANQTIAMSLGDFRATGLGSIATTSGLVAVAGSAQLGSVSTATATTAMSINGVAISASTVSDGVSTALSANSAIAKANQINSYTGQTGITAKANATVATGTAAVAVMAGTVAADTFTINGTNVMTAGLSWAASDANGVMAQRINMFSSKTGVTATETGGILTLTAADGRNIDVVGAGAFAAGAVSRITTATYGSSITLTGDQDINLSGTAAGFASWGYLATQLNAAVDTAKRVSAVDVTTQSNATLGIQIIDSALKQVSDAEASLGALSNRLTNTISNIEIANENLSAANSRIMDTDFASETANMTRAQIIQQSSVAVLTQANSRPQIALTLLKG